MKIKYNLAFFFLTLLPSTALLGKDEVADTLGVDKAVAISPATLLSGKVSGVRVSSIDGSSNGDINVNIRGLNTMRGSSQPLWIVDGAIIGSSINQNQSAFFQTGGTNTAGLGLPDYSGCSYTAPLGNFSWLGAYEIESIEVLKDVSATAKYGLMGANGVIVITTRRPVAGRYNINWSSNVIADIPVVSDGFFRTDISHNHQVSLNGARNGGSSYNISAFVRQTNGIAAGNNSTDAGFAVNFETKANKVIWFGFNTFFAVGKKNNVAGTAYVASPSTTLLSRYPTAFSNDNLDGWMNDYDDNSDDVRSVSSAYLRVNILNCLYLKFNGGVDFQDNNRYFWYGNKTSFGRQFNGAAAIVGKSLLNYNADAILSFNRYLGQKSRLTADAGFECVGKYNNINTMNGTRYPLSELRAFGLSSSESINTIRRFKSLNNIIGILTDLSYDFGGYFGVTAAARIDKNLSFEKNFNVFPSAEAYVNLGKMMFSDAAPVSTLKLTGGYGYAGRDYDVPYECLGAYIGAIPEAAKGTDYYFNGLNRLISREMNVGIELGFIENRYDIAAKYYDKTTDDNFRIINFGKNMGQTWMATNEWRTVQERTSTLRNRGFELDGSFNFIHKKDFDWTMYGNYAYNVARVTSLDLLDWGKNDLVGCMYYAPFKEGKRIFSVPVYTGAIGTSLRVHRFTFDAAFSGAGDFWIVNLNKLAGADLSTIDFKKEDYYEEGDYVRFDKLAVSYDIPVSLKWVKSIRANLSCRNLFTFTKYSGLNPDINSFGVFARNNGADYGSYPQFRSIVFGVNFNF